MVECSHGKGETLGSSPGQATFFFRPVTFGGLVWVRARATSSNLKETVSLVSAWFRADSGMNLIKQGAKCDWSIELLGSSVVECLHGKRETLGVCFCRATFFFRPCDMHVQKQSRRSAPLFSLHT